MINWYEADNTLDAHIVLSLLEQSGFDGQTEGGGFDGVVETGKSYKRGQARTEKADTDNDGFIDKVANYKHGVFSEVSYLDPDSKQIVKQFNFLTLISRCRRCWIQI